MLSAILLASACSTKQESMPAKAEAASEADAELRLEGDSTIYGLACDGCNDTILILLSRIEDDPDTFNILDASRSHHVFGRPKIGDKIAIVVNRDDSMVADIVINTEVLKGEWCYMVTPKLRERAGMNKEMVGKARNPEADSIIKAMLQPQEFGIEIKGEQIVSPIGPSRNKIADENSPVIFPPFKRYRQWHLYNGQLILSETSRDTLGNVSITNNDTAAFVMLRRDTLVLRFSDKEQGYYRRNKEKKN